MLTVSCDNSNSVPMALVGILRCNIRMINATLPFDTQCPILLPSKSHYVYLLVLQTHQRLFHIGPSHTLQQLQMAYWLCHGHAAVCRILSRCMICKRSEATAFLLHAMPPLPKERATQSLPLTFVGLDYLGSTDCQKDHGENVIPAEPRADLTGSYSINDMRKRQAMDLRCSRLVGQDAAECRSGDHLFIRSSTME